VSARKKEGKDPDYFSKEEGASMADHGHRPASIIPSSSCPFSLSLFLSFSPFSFLSSVLSISSAYSFCHLFALSYLSLRERCPFGYVQLHPRGLPRSQPSLGVPRGQTSSQKLRYVGRSTAAHPEHPLTRETHASLLNQRRNQPLPNSRLPCPRSPVLRITPASLSLSLSLTHIIVP